MRFILAKIYRVAQLSSQNEVKHIRAILRPPPEIRRHVDINDNAIQLGEYHVFRSARPSDYRTREGVNDVCISQVV